MTARSLRPVRCPLTPAAVDRLRPLLQAALAGAGPPLLPVSTKADAAAFDLDRPTPPGTAVVIATSGSTGSPKGVVLGAAALQASAAATAERLGGPGDWVLALPLHHVAGLQVLVRAIVAGSQVSTVDCTNGFTPEAFEAAVRALPERRRYASLVPTQLARVLDAGGEPVAAAASCTALLVGAAATPPALLARAQAAGLHPVTTYGMSETSGGCVYNGVPLSGVRVRLDPAGLIQLAGPTLATGYLHDPERTAAAFADGWFTTTDVGRLDDTGLEVLGRADDVVNSGGEKIPPALVERALRTVSGVVDACVVALPDPRWGQVVAAAVTGPVELDPAVLRDAVRHAVGRHAVPKRLLVLPALPMLAAGKVDRARVSALLAGAP